MKKKLAILFAALLGAGLIFNPAAKAIGFEVTVGDRDYYEGPGYWDYGWYWVWVPGHWGPHHHWIHGYYQRRGEWSASHLREHHDWRRHHHEHEHEHDHDHD